MTRQSVRTHPRCICYLYVCTKCMQHSVGWYIIYGMLGGGGGFIPFWISIDNIPTGIGNSSRDAMVGILPMGSGNT